MALSDIGKSQKKMMSLFSGGEEASTRSLAYTAPKEPSNQKEAPKESEAAQPQKSAESMQYAYAGRTRLYRLESGAYAAVSNEQLGIVLLGNASNWQLLVYDATKTHLLSAPVFEIADSLIPQANDYVSFSAKGLSWSAHMAAGAYDFTRAVFLCARVSKPSDLIHSETTSTELAGIGDSIHISYRQWGSDPKSLKEAAVPEAKDITCISLQINEAQSIDQCLSAAVLNASAGLRRGIFFKDHWIEFEIISITKPRTHSLQKKEEASLSPPPQEAQQPQQQERTRSTSITERMAGLAAVGGLPPMVVPSAALQSKEPQAEEIKAPTPAPTPAPGRQENQVALIPGQETARSYYAANAASAPVQYHHQNRYEEPSHAYGLATGNALAVQQTSLLAVQSSLSQLHEKIDRIAPTRGAYGAEADLDSLESRVTDLFRDYRQLKSSGGAREKRREEIEEKLEVLREKNAALLSDKLELMEKLHSSSDSKQEREALADRLSQAQRRYQELENQLEAASREASDAKNARNQIQNELATLQTHLSTLEQRSTATNGETSRLQDEVKQALEEKEAAIQRASQAESENLDLKAELEVAKHKLNTEISIKASSSPDSNGRGDKEALVKAVMNDTYKQLYAHFSGNADSSFSATDVTKTLKSVLKAVTAQHLKKLAEEEN